MEKLYNERQNDVKNYQIKFEEDQKKIEEMRHDYLKDLSHLREYMFQKDQAKADYIDVRYFEASKDLDEKIQAIINEKVGLMALKFNTQLHQLQKTNEIYYKQITLFEMICRDGNHLISLHELNAIDIIRKLHIVEKSPQNIWKALESSFGYGFFTKVLEEEYGITPDFQEKIRKEFSEELSIVKHDAATKINKVASQANQEILKLAKELSNKNSDLSNKRQEYIQSIEMIKDQMKFGIQKDHLKMIADLEKEYLNQIAFQKQQLFIYENGFRDGHAIEKDEWKKFYDKEIEQVRDSNIQLIKKGSELGYNIQKQQAEIELLKHQFSELNMELEQSQNEQLSKRKQLTNLEYEVKSVRQTFQDSANYIEILEKEFERLNQQGKKLARSNPELEMMIQVTPLKQLQKMKFKASHDMNISTQKNLQLILYDKKRDKYTLTEIYDVHKDLNFKVTSEILLKPPMNDVNTQYEPHTKEMQTQIGQAVFEQKEKEVLTDVDIYKYVEMEQKAENLDKIQPEYDRLVSEEQLRSLKTVKSKKSLAKSNTKAMDGNGIKKSKTLMQRGPRNMEKSSIEQSKASLGSEKSSINYDDNSDMEMMKDGRKRQVRNTIAGNFNDSGFQNIQGSKSKHGKQLYDSSVKELPKDEDNEEETTSNMTEDENQEDEDMNQTSNNVQNTKMFEENLKHQLDIGQDLMNISIKINESQYDQMQEQKARKKKQKSKRVSPQRVHVYKIVPYNLHSLGKILDHNHKILKASKGVQTESEEQCTDSSIFLTTPKPNTDYNDSVGLQAHLIRSQSRSRVQSHHATPKNKKAIRTQNSNNELAKSTPNTAQFYLKSDKKATRGDTKSSNESNNCLKSFDGQFKSGYQTQMKSHNSGVDINYSFDNKSATYYQDQFKKSSGTVQRLKELQESKYREAGKFDLVQNYQISRNLLLGNQLLEMIYQITHMIQEKPRLEREDRAKGQTKIRLQQTLLIKGKNQRMLTDFNYAEIIQNEIRSKNSQFSHDYSSTQPGRLNEMSQSMDSRHGARKTKFKNANFGLSRINHGAHNNSGAHDSSFGSGIHNNQASSYKQRRKIYSHFHSTANPSQKPEVNNNQRSIQSLVNQNNKFDSENKLDEPKFTHQQTDTKRKAPQFDHQESVIEEENFKKDPHQL
ncbi:UNKNOWN [Stylonychia lemnae]|uniref:Uncharacterized protein n=1 Tax=Stylonychia lemnae TaxID=5949 RepID=A0A078B6J5_STYLE|nr:UNKNOWN [Stylonychia lemnae]|eukprot:CDW88897.1 UNKNOWN [Stylonychia lemnae]